jgi:hypothetical protein
MSTTTFVIDAPAATRCMPVGRAVAPLTFGLGSESAYTTAGNPGFGVDARTGANGIVRVRDAKQAAPPRGELR